MSTMRVEQLESVQAYPTFGGKRKIVNEITYKCGYCMTNYVEEENGTCQACLDDLKELEE